MPVSLFKPELERKCGVSEICLLRLKELTISYSHFLFLKYITKV